MKIYRGMKIFFVLLFISAGQSNPAQETPMKYFLVETREGEYETEDLVNAPIEIRAAEKHLTYHFYSYKNPNEAINVTSKNFDELRNSDFNSNKETLFSIHGWKGKHESNINQHIRDSILKSRDINLFIADWSPVAGKNYLTAKSSVVKIGNYIASFIQQLVSVYGISVSNVALVGHSLGAHIAGNAGAALGGEVDHIVGLDPAGPLFSVSNTDNRLDPTDAKFVHVIHTNGGQLGFSQSAGHADYFPNGGSSQPGCGLDIAGGCSHSRAYEYYSESIKSNLFLSRKCSSYKDYSKDKCVENAPSIMGGFGVDYGANGDYYLVTNKASPFAQG